MQGIDVLGNGWNTGVLGVFSALVAGLVVALSPSTLPLIAVITGYVLGAEAGRGWTRLAAFLAGIMVAGLVLGIVFGAAGWLLGSVIGPAWNGLIGLLLVVMGLRLLGILKFRGIALRTERRQMATCSAAFFFGMPFVFAL
jgi:cytochrome c biogenesis protein CcdA